MIANAVRPGQDSTYGRELGFSLAQVSMRAGLDPAAAKHDTGRVRDTDRQLADAIARLLANTSDRTDPMS